MCNYKHDADVYSVYVNLYSLYQMTSIIHIGILTARTSVV